MQGWMKLIIGIICGITTLILLSLGIFKKTWIPLIVEIILIVIILLISGTFKFLNKEKTPEEEKEKEIKKLTRSEAEELFKKEIFNDYEDYVGINEPIESDLRNIGSEGTEKEPILHLLSKLYFNPMDTIHWFINLNHYEKGSTMRKNLVPEQIDKIMNFMATNPPKESIIEYIDELDPISGEKRTKRKITTESKENIKKKEEEKKQEEIEGV